jgi:hydrogenase maturation protein HypF
MEKGFNCPMTSSAGRLFDAVAAIALGRDRVSYEGQAAVELEQLAGQPEGDESYPVDIGAGETMVVDTRPIIAGVVADVRRGATHAAISRRFHMTMAEMTARVCRQIGKMMGVGAVVLSGGVFLNALLTHEATKRLKADGFRVYRHSVVPPNDGGICLGQLAVVAAMHGATQVQTEALCALPYPAK